MSQKSTEQEFVERMQSFQTFLTYVWRKVYEDAIPPGGLDRSSDNQEEERFQEYLRQNESMDNFRIIYHSKREEVLSLAHFIADDDMRNMLPYRHLVPYSIINSDTLDKFLKAMFNHVHTGNAASSPESQINLEFTRTLEAVALGSLAPRQIVASNWTGRRTRTELVAAILAHVPVAQEALRILIEAEERRLHNQSLTPLEQEAFNNLKQLYSDLGELLQLAEQGKGVIEALVRVTKTASRLFKTQERFNITVRGLEIVGLSLVPTYAAVKSLELVFGHSLDGASEATLAAAVIATTYMATDKAESP